MGKKVHLLQKICVLTWLGSMLLFVIVLAIGTNKFSTDVGSTEFGKSAIFDPLLIGIIILGVVAFGMAIIVKPTYTFLKFARRNPKQTLLGLTCLVTILLASYYYAKANSLLDKFAESIKPIHQTYQPPKPTISADEVFNLSNSEREKANLKPLQRNQKLEAAALERAKVIIESQDWSHEADKSGLTYQKAMSKSQYFNIVKGENLAKDQMTSYEVVQQWMKSPSHRDNILDNRYQEMGIATYSGVFAGRDTVVTVQLFGGYVPPNYTKEVIDSWESSLIDLKKTLPSWENTRNSPNLYPNNKEKCERIITIIQTRINKISQVVTQMKANKYLSSELDTYTRTGDTALYNESQTLATYLNSQSW